MQETLVKKELLELRRDGRAKALGLGLLLLLVTAALASWAYAWRLRTQRQADWRTNEAQFLAQGSKDPHAAAHYGFYVFKPVAPLAVLDHGVEPWVGNTLWLEAHKQNDFKYRPAKDAGLLARFGDLSPAYLFQILAPLFIIFLAHGAFAREREQGTLKLAASQGASMADLWRSKLSAHFQVVVRLCWPMAAVGVVAVLAMSQPDQRLDTLLRLALWLLVYGAYGLAWLFIALALSAACANARRALVACLAAWVFACLVLPRAASQAAKTLVPTPTAAQFAADLGKNFQGDGHWTALAKKNLAEALKKHHAKSVKELPFSFRGYDLDAQEKIHYPVFDQAFGDLYGKLYRQDAWRLGFGLLSPLLLVQAASSAVAGTDLRSHRDFAQRAELYRRDFIASLNAELMADPSRIERDYTIRRGNDVWAKVPRFSYGAPRLGQSLGWHWASLAALLAWVLAAAGLSRWAALRQSVL